MNPNKLKLVVAVIAVLPLLAWSSFAIASYTEGILTTGLNANNGQTVNGVVIAPPTANPVAGTYTSVQSVTLSSAGSSSIHFTFDGTVPGCDSLMAYQTAIPVSSSLTIKAVSCYQDNLFRIYSSSVAVFDYVIALPVAPTPTPTPVPVAQVSTGSNSGSSSSGGTPVAPTTIKTGDANNDGKVDKYDFSLMMSNWGKTGINAGDFNIDGKVDKYDFALLMSNWGK